MYFNCLSSFFKHSFTAGTLGLHWAPSAVVMKDKAKILITMRQVHTTMLQESVMKNVVLFF